MNYRHLIYHYSTGLGPNLADDIPLYNIDSSSYSMTPLLTPQANAQSTVDLKREADSVSMQVESTLQMLKTLGGKPSAHHQLKVLKDRLDVITKLRLFYPQIILSYADLNKLYKIGCKHPKAFKKAIHRLQTPRLFGKRPLRPYDKFGPILRNPKTTSDFQLSGIDINTIPPWMALGGLIATIVYFIR